MKKQFFRVKQLAGQQFSRAEKTETLSEDLSLADKRIEFLHKTSKNVSSKIYATLLTTGQDVAREKRITKSPEYVLGETFMDTNTADVDDTLKDILIECSKIQMCLARTSVDTDTRVESDVYKPLHQMENDLQNINKQKRNLSKLILDMDATRSRYKSSNSSGSTTKADSVKDELIELEKKVEQSRDSLACEMFNAISKEADLVNILLHYMKLQQTAHRAALSLLDEMVPELESKIESSTMKPVFHYPLQEHLKVTNRKIAYPLELCVCVLLELGMEEEGLFRVAGASSKIRRLKLGFDVGFITMETALEYRDVHVFSSVLKSYFRELPDSLLTNALYEEWLATIKYTGDEDTRLTLMWNVLHKLPAANYDNLRYLIKFLSKLTQNQEKNKMTPQNLAIVIAPSLVGNSDGNDSNVAENMMLVNQEVSLYSSIVEYLIKYADWFFPGDEAFYVTLDELNNTTKRHTRSSSADMRLVDTEFCTTLEPNSMKRCQSTTSLEDQTQSCSPSPDSPKPVTRTRKNKPAPIPPFMSGSTSPSASVSTVTITTNSGNSTSPKDKGVAVRVSVKNSQKYGSTASDETSLSRHESFNFNEYSDKTDGPDKEEKHVRNAESRISAEDELTCEISKRLNVDSMTKVVENKKMVKPVPAPRISLETQPRSTVEEVVILRKPVIPEKPTTLPRPVSCSFKSFKALDPSDVIKIDVEKSKGPSLEKAYLYTVDKQQVSFIDIASASEDIGTFDSNQDTSRLRGSITDKNSSEKLSTVTCDRGQNSSHTRTLSDGYTIDLSNPANLPPHRSFSRVQRPIPPPPPPPMVTKLQSRPGSLSDSTNL